MKLKNNQILHALQDAAKLKNYEIFLNKAIEWYTMCGRIPTGNLDNLVAHDIDAEEKNKLMYAELIRIQNSMNVR